MGAPFMSGAPMGSFPRVSLLAWGAPPVPRNSAGLKDFGLGAFLEAPLLKEERGPLGGPPTGSWAIISLRSKRTPSSRRHRRFSRDTRDEETQDSFIAAAAAAGLLLLLQQLLGNDLLLLLPSPAVAALAAASEAAVVEAQRQQQRQAHTAAVAAAAAVGSRKGPRGGGL